MTAFPSWLSFIRIFVGIIWLGAIPSLFAEEVEFDLSQATPENPGPWKIFAAPPNVIDPTSYVELPWSRDGQARVLAVGAPMGNVPSPSVKWIEKERVRLTPFSNQKLRTPTFMPDRDILVAWTCPSEGSWKISAVVENEGTDVDGGDGGKMTLSRLGPGDAVDAGTFAVESIPTKKAEKEPVALGKVVKLKAGDRILLRVNSGIDTYGDGFMFAYRIGQSDEAGEEVVNRGFAAALADPPLERATAGAPLRRGLFWVGNDGKWANSDYAKESIELIRKFVPDLAVVMFGGRPELYRQPSFYRAEGIPTIIQTWGAGYEPWLRSQKAFEINWEGIDLGVPSALALSGTAHAAALPHPATREAFAHVIQAAIRCGYSAFGYCDMVWMWGGGRGRSGYNPETIAAFRRDLLGEDEGLSLTMPDERQAILHFGDYANFYLGGQPRPEDMGLAGWATYSPPTKVELERRGKTDTTPDFLLFDLLVHYEWLKFNDALGGVAREEGGSYQCMPNPEDMANGVDLLFASRLNSVNAIGEEFFNSPSFLDTAYTRFGYLTQVHPRTMQVGVVMEGGGGGNGWPYYANEVAYATAYELALATRAEYCEGDFWPSQGKPLSTTVQVPEYLSRYRQVLAYGLGFKDGRLDGAVRIPADFTSVTSRRLFRPWDGEGKGGWTQSLNSPGSSDEVLAEGGFSFSGIGEEGLDGLTGPQKIVFYMPELPTEKGWRNVLEKVRSGQVKQLVVAAPALREVVTTQFRRRSMREVFPEWSVMGESPWSTSGDRPVAGPRYRLEGGETVASVAGQPTVVRKQIGQGWVYCLLFDPALSENAALAAETYRSLLAGCGVAPHWGADSGVMVRLYQGQKGMLIAGVQSDDVRSWKGTKGTSGGFRPYQISASRKARVFLTPNQAYAVLALPSGTREQKTADADGTLSFMLNHVSHEVFFILPADRAAELDAIASRKAIFDRAMTLDGLAGPPTP